MTIRLKQSTAGQEIPLGYFLDQLDGNTEETELTIANTDIKLWKMGATSLVNKNSGGATHMANGLYYTVLDATDTNTLGALVVFVHVSGALAVKVECEVQAANVYDSLIGGGDYLQVDVTQWNNSNVATPATAGYPVVTHKVGTGTGEMNLSGGRTPADVTYWNGAAVATPATAGHPVVTHKVGTGTGELSISSGVVSADMTRVSGDSVAADNAESFFDGTGYAGTNNVIPVVGAVTGAVGSVTGNVGGNVAGSVGSVTGAVGSVTGNVAGSVGSVTGNVGGDVAGSVASVTGNVGGDVTGSVGSLATQAKADVNAQMVDVLATDTFGEPAGVPAATASLKDKIGWVFMLARNKRITSATQDKVRNDGDSADVGTAGLNDDGTNFSRGEYA